MKKVVKKIMAGTLYLGLIMGMATAVNQTDASAKKVKVDKVTVSSPSGKTAYIAKGKKVKLTVTVKVNSKKKADKKVTYKSANKKIASVNGKGIVKGVKVGKTKITVTSSKNKKKKATIKVVVKKDAVKSVKMKEKSVTISVGDKKTLKATVTPKKASNAIEWSSSKSSVASVSDKGVVTGKKAGTAVITAKAADGSGKKATVKVTVTNTVNMAAMDVQNVQTVTFALDKAQALTADNIIVKTKAYANGEYRSQLKIDNVSTVDNVNYTVVLNNNTRIYVNNYVQVSVPALSGAVKSMEKEYTEQICAFTDEEISSWTVNKYGYDSYTFGSAYGYSSYTITGLPAGLVSEVRGDYMYVKGTPAATGSTTATLSAVDEKGNTLTKSIYFIVGSEDVIVGAGMPEYTLVSNTTANNVDTYASFTGGTGYYDFEIINDGGTGAKIDSYGSSSSKVWIEAKISAPGNYNVVVRATDDKKRTCDVTIPIYVSQGIAVAGLVKDASGNPMPNASIVFTNKNRADRFCRTGYYSTDKNGSYSATISAGSYDIAASYHNDEEYCDNAKATRYLYKQDLSATRSGFDVSLPLYKVVLVSADAEKYPLTSSDGYSYYGWYSNNEYLGSGDTLYLKNGNYTIETKEQEDDVNSQKTGDWFNGQVETRTYGTYKLAGSAAVNGAAAQVSVSKVPGTAKTDTVTMPAAKDTTYKVTVDERKYLDDAGRYYAYSFTPDTTGQYSIYSEDDDVKFYDMATGKAVPLNSYGYYALTAGTKYIVGTGYYNEDEAFRIYYYSSYDD